MAIQVRCEHCRQKLRIDASKIGLQARCPACRQSTRLEITPEPGTWFVKSDDGEIHGPLTYQKLQQWKEAGRLTGNTPITPRYEGMWQPAEGAFPSLFAVSAEAISSPSSPGDVSASTELPNPFETARRIKPPRGGFRILSPYELPPDPLLQRRVQAPALALVGISLLGLALWFTGLLKWISGLELPLEANPLGYFLVHRIWPSGFAGLLYLFVASTAIGLAAYRMSRMEMHWYAVVISVWVMLPCASPCCLLGLPIGIWSLGTLMDTKVRAEFRDGPA